MRVNFIDQDQRVCAKCGKKFLSGVVHLDRGWAGAAVCKPCFETTHPSWPEMKGLTDKKRRAALKGE